MSVRVVSKETLDFIEYRRRAECNTNTGRVDSNLLVKDVGLCLYLYRDYSEAEKEQQCHPLIDYLIAKIEP